MRVGGMVLILAFLSIIATYLIIQKGWVEPFSYKFNSLDGLIAQVEDLRVRVLTERVVCVTNGIGSEWIVSTRQKTTDVLASVKSSAAQVDRVHGSDFHEFTNQWSGIESDLDLWRRAIIENKYTEPIVEALPARLERTKNLLRARQVGFGDRLNELVFIRTGVLLAVSVLGGIGTWLATLSAVRRSRKSLRNIADHVSAIERGELTPRNLDAFTEISEVNHRLNNLGIALARAREETRSEHDIASARQAELEIAHELVLDMSKARTESEVVQAFYKYAPKSLNADRIEILRLVNPPGILEELPHDNEGGKHKNRIIEDPNRCLAFHTLDDAARPNRGQTCPASPVAGHPTLCIPMKTAYGQVGVVHICPRAGEPIETVPRTLAETFVRLFAPALENARLLRESIERGSTDPLTGLANRRRLEEFATKAIALAIRQQSPLSVVALDLDKFKSINDEFGHEVGDRALVSVAQALQAAIRETDIASRLGGDEFVLVLPGSSGQLAVRVVERIRALLSRPIGKHLPVELHLSAGIAELSPRAKTLQELVAFADRALYDAKRLSRGIGHARLEESELDDERAFDR